MFGVNRVCIQKICGDAVCFAYWEWHTDKFRYVSRFYSCRCTRGHTTVTVVCRRNQVWQASSITSKPNNNMIVRDIDSGPLFFGSRIINRFQPFASVKCLKINKFDVSIFIFPRLFREKFPKTFTKFVQICAGPLTVW